MTLLTISDRSCVCICDTGAYNESYASWDHIFLETVYSKCFDVFIATVDIARLKESKLWEYLNDNDLVSNITVNEIDVSHIASHALRKMWLMTNCENLRYVNQIDNSIEYYYYFNLGSTVHIASKPWSFIMRQHFTYPVGIFDDDDGIQNSLDFFISNSRLLFSSMQNLWFYVKPRFTSYECEWQYIVNDVVNILDDHETHLAMMNNTIAHMGTTRFLNRDKS